MTGLGSYLSSDLTPREEEEEDRRKTGRWRCIGCGKFLKADAKWNQCGECDTRSPEGQAYGGSW